ncbi:filamentous hemagglutinin N-terminal domain-containing protein [Bradyrhizobium sp. Ai1a-2]|uniref:two-partner secretion domain-containing protein n=1 Tax=Bradyrhizobium sp. Ai1a-2 TaxID=196490 RepID=UPI000420654A
MSARIAFPPVAFRAVSLSRSILLAGVSAAALLAGTSVPAGARPLGGANTSATGVAAAAAQASAQAAAAVAAQAMSRANASMQALRNAQDAARAAALSGASKLGQQLPDVPNGLSSGGLNPTGNPNAIVDGQPAWTGADLPTQSVSANGRIQVDIVQRQQKAILTWDKFNVGRETDLYFNQAAGGGDAANWIALNRVIDPSAMPSQILGTIRAEGQVYIINQNGIIFGGASQVNVGALVASSLSLSNQQFMAGINAQLLIWNDVAASSIAMPQFGYLGQQKPNLSVGVNNPQQIPAVAIGRPPGDVTVQAGASIETASGGKAMLFAPRVSNAGRVAAPDGQVIMAAGEQVYLLTDQTGVRGLDVAVSAPMPWAFNYDTMAIATGQLNFPGNAFTNDLKNLVLPGMEQRAETVGYQVLNTGLVETTHGNITLMGREVVQNGALIASTALNNRDGSIRLRAWGEGMMSYSSTLAGLPLKYWSAGTLVLSPGSVTTVVPDLTDTSPIEATAAQTRYTPGRVELRGKLIDIETRANVIVPAGTISIVASTSALSGDTVTNPEPTIRDGSRIYLGEDAFVSVAGLLDVPVAMESNLVAVNMRINELRDSPLYKDSWLSGVTVYVDKRKKGTFSDGPMAGVNWIPNSPGAWVGTPLGDASGWIGNDLTTLAQLMTGGGKIAIKSSGSLITRLGSMLDVSGGSIRYQGGYVNTTKLIGSDGRIYDISQATPDRVYVGIASGFTVRHSGKINEIFANPLLGRATWEAGYTEGRAAGEISMFAGEGTVLEGSYYGGVIIGERQAASGQVAKAGSLKFGEASDAARTWLLGDLTFTKDPVLLPADFNAKTPLDSSWYWGTSGVSGAADDVTSFRKRGTYIDTDVLGQSGLGKIDLYVSTGFTLGAGEKLELAPGSTFSVLPNTAALYPANQFQIDGTIRSAGGTVKLSGRFGASSVIDVSGRVVNDFAGERRGQPLITGGNVALNGEFAAGATIDVSGGAWLTQNGSKNMLKVGDAGTATIGGVTSEELAGLDLRGYAAGSGATLELNVDGAVQIGGSAPADMSILHLPPTLFGERGVRVLSISGGNVIVPDGVTASLVPVSVAGVNFDFASGAPITRDRHASGAQPAGPPHPPGGRHQYHLERRGDDRRRSDACRRCQRDHRYFGDHAG